MFCARYEKLFFEYLHKFRERIVVLVNDALFQRDDGVVGNGDVFGANFGAAFCDVAVTDAEKIF